MLRMIRLCVAGALALVVAGAADFGVAQGVKPAKARRVEPAFQPVEDQPGLPRVLLIGDSISIGYTLPVREALQGKANVHRPAANCGPTSRGLENLDRWIAGGPWDVIHFNWGLHDLYRDNGKPRVPPEQYEKNLCELTARLKKTGARLIWCSTTPVPAGCEPARYTNDAPAYNEIARKIMEENRITIDDLYGFALAKLAEIQMPKNVHFTAEGSKVLARQVAASILDALKR